MKMNLKVIKASYFASVLIPALTIAAPNPCSTECVQNLINSSPAIGRFTSNSWINACPTGARGLSQGCLTNGAAAAASPIAPVINLMFNRLNTSPKSTDYSVYIRKFSPGYIFTANSGKNITLDGTTVATTTGIFCSPAYLENGILVADSGINNNTNGFSDGLSQVGDGYHLFGGAQNTNWTILASSPGTPSTALPLNVAIYTVCVGTDRQSGVPASIAGFSAY